MRAAFVLAGVLVCAGCVVDVAPVDDGDAEIGEAREAMSSFTASFKFSWLRESERRFSVPNHGVVTVAARARWDRPAACNLPTYKIELVKDRIGPDLGKGARTYPTSGVMHTETWSGLDAGTYYFILSSTNTGADCNLVGTMNVTIKP